MAAQGGVQVPAYAILMMTRKSGWSRTGIAVLGILVVSMAWFVVGIFRALLTGGLGGWTSDLVETEITITWMVANLSPLVLTRSRKLSFRHFSGWAFVVLGLEVAAIASAFIGSRLGSSRYSALGGSLLLLAGWLLANRYRVCGPWPTSWRRADNAVRRGIHRAARSLLSLFPAAARVESTTLCGEGIQLLGLAVLWRSPSAFAFAFLVFPILSTVKCAAMERHQHSDETLMSHHPRPWLSRAIGSVLLLLLQATIVTAVPVILLGVIVRDLPLFYGDLSRAVGLLGTLVQLEASVVVLGVTLLFVLVEMTASTYSPRLAQILLRRRPFSLMAAATLLSLVVKTAILSNAARVPGLSNQQGSSILVDVALLSTALALSAFVWFVLDVFRMMSPEEVVAQTLKGLDWEWMEVIRREWSSRRVPQSVLIARDPLVRIEAVLVPALNRGDLNSFRTSIRRLADRLRQVSREGDGAVLDAYLAHHLGNTVRSAAKQGHGRALRVLCGAMNEVTMPSVDSVAEADSATAWPPPGSKLPRLVIEEALEHDLPDAATMALHFLNDRGTQAVRALPPYSGLLSINWPSKTERLTDEEREARRRNDAVVRRYRGGHLGYFGWVGTQAVEASMARLSSTASHCLGLQACEVVNRVKEEPYQAHLMQFLLQCYRGIVRMACRGQLANAVDIGMLQYAVRQTESRTIATLVCSFIADTTVRMAKAGLLDFTLLADSALATLEAAEKHDPEVLAVQIQALGEAGVRLREHHSFKERDELKYVHQKVVERIGQLERYGRRFGIQWDISEAAQKAREKAGDAEAP